MNPKGIFFGIDGGTWRWIGPFMDRGLMPNLARLRQEGASGQLETSIPSQTVPAWGCITSGVNPGKLGLFHFVANSHADYDEGPPTGTSHVKVKSIWHYLTEHGRKSIVINTPLSFPTSRFDGVMISPQSAQFGQHLVQTHPPELMTELQKELSLDVGQFAAKLRRMAFLKNRRLGPGHIQQRRERLTALVEFNDLLTDMLEAMTLHLMRTREWDFLMTMFPITDTIQHHLWDCFDSQHPGYDARVAEGFETALERACTRVDRALGRVRDAAPPGTPIVIMSDHGFSSYHRAFNVNRWLETEGFLKRNGLALTEPIIKRYPMTDVLRRVGLGPLLARLPRAIRDARLPVPRRVPRATPAVVDWSATQAYGMSFGINLNLAGREPNGSLTAADRPDVVQRLRQRLMELRDPLTGEAVVAAVFEGSEIYSGPVAAHAPDLLFILHDGFAVRKSLADKDAVTAAPADGFLSGQHVATWSGWRDGLFFAAAPGIRPGSRAAGVRVLDLAPTMLHLLGIDPPEDMDGHVLDDLFEPSYGADHPTRRDPKASIWLDAPAATPVSEEEQRVLMDHLRNLGYLG